MGCGIAGLSNVHGQALHWERGSQNTPKLEGTTVGYLVQGLERETAP